MQGPFRGEGHAGFGVQVGLREGADDFFARGLRERDGDDGGLAAEFGVADCEEGGAGLGAAEEGEVQGDGVRLVLGGEGAAEVGFGDLEEEGGYVAAVGDWKGGLGLAWGVWKGSKTWEWEWNWKKVSRKCEQYS